MRYWILINCLMNMYQLFQILKKITDKDVGVKVPNYIMNDTSQMCILFEIRVHYWSNPVIFQLCSGGALGPMLSIGTVYHITSNYICLIYFLLTVTASVYQ